MTERPFSYYNKKTMCFVFGCTCGHNFTDLEAGAKKVSSFRDLTSGPFDSSIYKFTCPKCGACQSEELEDCFSEEDLFGGDCNEEFLIDNNE